MAVYKYVAFQGGGMIGLRISTITAVRKLLFEPNPVQESTPHAIGYLRFSLVRKILLDSLVILKKGGDDKPVRNSVSSVPYLHQSDRTKGQVLQSFQVL